MSGIVGGDGVDLGIGDYSFGIDRHVGQILAAEAVVDRHLAEIDRIGEDQVIADHCHRPVAALGESARIAHGRLPAEEGLDLAYAILDSLGRLECNSIGIADLFALRDDSDVFALGDIYRTVGVFGLTFESRPRRNRKLGFLQIGSVFGGNQHAERTLAAVYRLPHGVYYLR